MMSFARVLLALVVSACSVGAFVPCPSALAKVNQRAAALTWPQQQSSSSSAQAAAAARQPAQALFMGWGDALGKAFANEDMAPVKNPGLKNEPNSCMVSEGVRSHD